MKKVALTLTSLIGLLIVAVIVITFVPHIASSNENDPLAGVKAAGMNAVIEASGLKTQAMHALQDNIDSISAATGLSTADCNQIIYGLDLKNWEATVLPNAAEEVGTLSGDYVGIDGTVTFYDDPEYVTVNAFGQKVTMRIPETAQSYIPYLQLGE